MPSDSTSTPIDRKSRSSGSSRLRWPGHSGRRSDSRNFASSAGPASKRRSAVSRPIPPLTPACAVAKPTPGGRPFKPGTARAPPPLPSLSAFLLVAPPDKCSADNPAATSDVLAAPPRPSAAAAPPPPPPPPSAGKSLSSMLPPSRPLTRDGPAPGAL